MLITLIKLMANTANNLIVFISSELFYLLTLQNYELLQHQARIWDILPKFVTNDTKKEPLRTP